MTIGLAHRGSRSSSASLWGRQKCTHLLQPLLHIGHFLLAQPFPDQRHIAQCVSGDIFNERKLPLNLNSEAKVADEQSIRWTWSRF